MSALILFWGCSATPRPEPALADTTLLRITTQPDSIILCEGMQRRVAVGVSWADSQSPAVSALPELTWRNDDPEVVALDSTGAIMGLRPGEGRIIVFGTVGDAYGRAVLPVRVLPELDRDGNIVRECD